MSYRALLLLLLGLVFSDLSDVGPHIALAAKLSISSRLVVAGPHSVLAGARPGFLHGKLGLNTTGKPAWTKKKLAGGAAQMTTDEKREAHRGYCFNTRVSASLPLNRKLENLQPKECLGSVAMAELPKASVVIVFVNEDLSVLLRSLHSVLNRSPQELLVGIELVDDGSDSKNAPWLFEELEAYVALLPKTRLWRLGQRSGLMSARVFGAQKAAGPALVFLDSHIECAEGWLQPLLRQIAADSRSAPMPVIGSLDADTFEPNVATIRRFGLGTLGFHWRLGQKHLPSRTRKCGLMGGCPSPIMPGGLFAIDKTWFLDELEGYDSEMQVYGGEEMEISFKLWQCGGKVELVPCSHVYHVFRSSRYWQGQVFSVDAEAIYRNKLRAAEVWMDEFGSLVRLSMSPLSRLTIGDLSAARAVRERLRCKDFRWYLREVYPELHVPNLTGSTAGSLRVKHFVSEGICVDTLGDHRWGQHLGAFGCHGQHGAQAMLHTADGKLRLGTEDYEGCAVPDDNEYVSEDHVPEGEDESSASSRVMIGSCAGPGTWHHHRSGQFRFIAADASKKSRCLTVGWENEAFTLDLKKCQPKNVRQIWHWTPPTGYDQIEHRTARTISNSEAEL